MESRKARMPKVAMLAMLAALSCGVPERAAALTQSPSSAGRTTALTPYTLDRSAVIALLGPGDENYVIMVAWPDGPPPPSGWPVLYVLDGEDNFATLALAARRLARARERSGIVPGIVVGVAAGPLARRVRDYTPQLAGYRIPRDRPAAGLNTGGADEFLNFLRDKVMPEVQKRWSVDTGRETLAGHSFGGLLALHAMLDRPAMVDKVVAVSPSFWFGNGYLARQAANAKPPQAPSAAIVIGEKETGAAEGARAFIAALCAGRQVAVESLPGQSHGTTMLAAVPRIIAEAFAEKQQ